MSFRPDEAAGPGQRCDVWLFRARLFKSRALAAACITSGAVRVERAGGVQRLSRPAAAIRPGDTLIFMRGGTLVRVTVLDLGARRGPPAEARRLYTQDGPPHAHSD
ncbi:RNA-binding S4 domain-containing protein [Alkalicaulis satelles]|uniref:RNA-binding S4 domain-containing protein n=1 Tax=Alkalicaulis satelles TaxID=2609175 RepID=A0A5M6ZIH8_9PROT|nr:RNA-binding S4 domain-containing protein [Alkalicaulis satelles]KAA5803507.1 RNA-binding S4 domain-containing protein [Alkalicaulis satelles]